MLKIYICQKKLLKWIIEEAISVYHHPLQFFTPLLILLYDSIYLTYVFFGLLLIFYLLVYDINVFHSHVSVTLYTYTNFSNLGVLIQ